jgi:hypothetical protein
MQCLVDPSIHKPGCQYFELLRGIAFNCNLPFGAYIEGAHCHVFLKHKLSKYMMFSVSEMGAAIGEIRSMVQ